jgi:hypothetical protein
LGRDYLSSCYTSSNQLLEELSSVVDNPGRGGKFNCPPGFNYTYESLFYDASVSFYEGRKTKEAKITTWNSKHLARKMRTSKCFTTDV